MMTRKLFEALGEDRKLDLWNEYADGGDRVWSNESWELILDELGWTPVETLRATVFGEVNWSDTYVWVNAYGNLQTSQFIDYTPYDEEVLWDYLVDAGEAKEDGDESQKDEANE